MSITFPVSEVDRNGPLRAALDRASVVPSLLDVRRSLVAGPGLTNRLESAPGPRIEAMSTSNARLVSASGANALAQAAHDAFFQHHPLVLSPDAVWFCLAQGFAHHVSLNSEALRARLVRHEGKKELIVSRDDFVLGRSNPWPEVFAEFSDQIATQGGRLRDLVVADFSTTGPIERAASEIVVMDVFQAYFDFTLLTGCGIPSITLTGTVDDWRSIRRRAAMLSEFGLEAWTQALLPVLDEVVRAADGPVDTDFWRSFFRYRSSSVGSQLTGWIHVLFPYLQSESLSEPGLVPNPYLGCRENSLCATEAHGRGPGHRRGPGLDTLPPSVASAPVRIVDLRTGKEHPVRFVAGLFGTTQDEVTGALAPEFGWAVVHDAPQVT